jgi:hypothetical protein
MFPELFLILVILIPLFAVVLESPVAQAIATRLERRDTNGAPEQTIDRIAYLEAEVDRLTNELMSLKEESQFLHRLLTERSRIESGVNALLREEDG